MCDNIAKFQQIIEALKSDSLKELFTSLKTAEADLCRLSQNIPDRAILILRNVNSDGRIFIRWITDQDSKLRSEPDKTRLGEYVIVDPEKNTGEIHPTCAFNSVHDAQADIFCDFPVFADSLSIADGISKSYFTKKAVEKIHNVKMCFIIEYYMVTSLGERNDLRNFLKHITEMANADMYTRNLLLVVSKVPSALSKESDNNIIRAITEIMNKLKVELNQPTEPTTARENTQITDLIDSLMLEENGQYPRIALFRSPHTQGPLSNVTSSNKDNVKEKLKNLHFVEDSNVGFGCISPDTSVHLIPGIMAEIRDHIAHDVEIGSYLIEGYFIANDIVINSLDNLKQAYNQMETNYEKMLAIKTFASASDNSILCLNRIIDGVSNITNNAIILDLSPTLIFADIFELLHNMISHRNTTFAWCSQGLANIIHYLDNSRKWYSFAIRLYNRLLNCEISKNLGTYNITLDDLDKKVSQTDLKNFLFKNSLEELLFVQYNDLKDVVLTESKIQSVVYIAIQVEIYRRTNPLCIPTPATLPPGPTITSLYKIREYFDDFFTLENQTYALSNRSLHFDSYESMLSRVNIFDEQMKTSPGYNQIEAALYYLVVTISSRIENIKNKYDNYVVVNVDGFFAAVKSHLQGYNNALDEVNLDKQEEGYAQTITMQIVEANLQLKAMGPDLNRIFAEMDLEMKRVVELLKRLEEDAERKRREFEAMRKDLDRLLNWRIVIGALQVVNAALVFLGPGGVIANGVIGAGLNWATTTLDHQQALIDGMAEDVGKTADFLNNIKPHQQRDIQHYLEDIDDIMDDLAGEDEELDDTTSLVHVIVNATIQDGEKSEWLGQIIVRLEDKLGSLARRSQQACCTTVQPVTSVISTNDPRKPTSRPTTKPTTRRTPKPRPTARPRRTPKTPRPPMKLGKGGCGWRAELVATPKAITTRRTTPKTPKTTKPTTQKPRTTTAVAPKTTQTETQDDRDAKEARDKRIEEWGKNTLGVLKAIQGGLAGYESVLQSKENAIRVGKQLDSAISNVRNVRDGIVNQLLPQIATMRDSIMYTLKKSGNKSSAALTRNKWLMQNMLKDIRDSIKSLDTIPTAGVPIIPNILTCIEKLDGAMVATFQIYDKVQEYQDRAKLAEQMTKLQRHDGLIDVPSDIRRMIHTLELQIKANLMLEECQRAVSVFKQYMFPFARKFLQRFNLTSLLRGDDINRMMRVASERINQLTDDMTALNNQQGGLPDPVFQKIRFVKEVLDQPPYFIWPHDTYGEKIHQLLQGIEIKLKADMMEIRNMNPVKLNAVRFNRIGIRFLSQNSTVENMLSTFMLNFYVEMIHLGDSHYRCDDNFYIFEHNVFNFAHSMNYEMDKSEIYYTYSTDHHMADNIPIYSPYATWRIRLNPKGNFNKSVLFRSLEIFKNERFDLALEGQGSFIRSPSQSCKDNLEAYYKLAGRIPDAENPIIDNCPYDGLPIFATNSANRIKAHVNIAVNWLTSYFGPIKSQWISNALRYNPITDGFTSIFAHSKLLDVHPNEECTSIATCSKFNVNDSLTLIDFFIRRLTKVKPYNNRKDESMNSIEIRALVLNLVEQVENLITFYLSDKSEQFDALVLTSKLEKELTINGNAMALPNIIYQAVVDANPILDHSQLGKHIRQKITKIVLQ